jgi:hypothetical protein
LAKKFFVLYRKIKLHNRSSLPVQSSVHFHKAIPITDLDRPWGFQEVQAPRFQDNRHMNVVRLSALRTGRLYILGSIPGTHFC